MTNEFKALFDELHAAEEQADTALESIIIADAATRKVRAAIWAAIDHAMAVHNDTHDRIASADDRIARLETIVLELTNRLLPPTEGKP